MKINSLSGLIQAILILAGGIVAYFVFYLGDENYTWALIPLGISIMLLYVFKGVLDAYWYKRNPPKLGGPIIAWLQKYFPFYNSLLGKDRQKFEDRLSIYLELKEFSIMTKAEDDMPDDAKAIIASTAIQMTMGLENYLIGDYDKIVCYKHPFPTPLKKFLHAVEVHGEDKLILLSLEQVMYCSLKPEDYYHVTRHAYAEALMNEMGWEKFEKLDVSFEDLHKVKSFTEEHILSITGLPAVDPKIVAVNYFFGWPNAFKFVFPEEHTLLDNLFNPKKP